MNKSKIRWPREPWQKFCHLWWALGAQVASERVVHALCPSPSDYRWLLRQVIVRGIATLTPDGFRVCDETQWQECLTAAAGQEIQ